jgi:choline-sulfatase
MSVSTIRILQTSLERLGLGGFWTPFRSGSETVDDLVRWLPTARKTPFFAWIHLFDPHFPYGPGFADHVTSERLRAAVLDGREPDREPIEELFRLYTRGVGFADAQIGRVLTALSALDSNRDTLIVVTSDHGETLTNPAVERRYWFHHADVYEDTARAILVINHVSRIRPATRIAEPVSLLDILPTILSLTGVAAREPDFRGKDLAPLLLGRSVAPEHKRCLVVQHATNSDLESWAVRQGEWKLVLRTPTGPAALYDLTTDPGETADRSADSPEVASRLRACFAEESHHYGSFGTAPRWLREDLRSLGYLH